MSKSIRKLRCSIVECRLGHALDKCRPCVAWAARASKHCIVELVLAASSVSAIYIDKLTRRVPMEAKHCSPRKTLNSIRHPTTAGDRREVPTTLQTGLTEYALLYWFFGAMPNLSHPDSGPWASSQGDRILMMESAREEYLKSRRQHS